jgi:ankyrin repeat protein
MLQHSVTTIDQFSLDLRNSYMPLKKVPKNIVDAAKQNNAAKLKELIDPKTITRCVHDEDPFLCCVASWGAVESAGVLIDAGCDVNEVGEIRGTPLIAACAAGDPKMVEFLLKQGADPHQCVEAYPPSAIISTLVSPDSLGHLEVLRLLLEAGVDPHETASGSWVLGNCISDYSYVDGIITMLTKAGADPNYLDPVRKTTALHMAVEVGSKAQVQELLDAGASPFVKAPVSDKPWSELDAVGYAEKLKRRAIVSQLASVTPQVSAAKPAKKKLADKNVKLPDAWQKLEQCLSDLEGECPQLAKGKDPKKLPSWAESLGDLYRRHNGQKGSPLFRFEDSQFAFLTSDRAVKEYNLMCELLAGGDFEGLIPNPSKGVSNNWWNERWFPIGRDSFGNLLCVDYCPAKLGVVGQVIRVFNDMPKRDIVANSMAELLLISAKQWAT